MAITKVSRGLLSTGVSDSSDATAITIDSSENVGIGTASPNAVLTTDPESGNFSSAYNNYDGVGLFIRGNGTAGNGNYGPALVFGSCDSDTVNQDNKHCAISIVQTGTDANETGLAFWTHPTATSTDALSESMRIDSSGNVGINTTSPDRLFHIKRSDSGGTAAKFENSAGSVFIELNTNNQVGGDAGYIGYNSTKDMLFLTDDTERMRIDGSGNVGIGLTNPSAYGKLAVTGTATQLALNASSGKSRIGFFEAGTGRFYIDTLNGADGLAFVDADGSTERMRIASGGGVAIGTTTPDGVSNLTVKSQNSTAGQEFVSLHHQASSGTIYFMSFMTGSGSDVGYITFTGTTGAFTAASDISLKENIRDLPEGLDVITQLKPRLFDWKEEGKGSDQVGFIAQEVEEIKPEWIHQKEDIKLLSSNLPDSIPYLIKAIQEQQAIIDNLKARIEVLEA